MSRSGRRGRPAVALPLALVTLLGLAALTSALLGLAAVEPATGRHATDAAQARWAAEAGLAEALAALRASPDWTALLRAGPTRWDGTLPAGAARYEAQVRNDTSPADRTLTGAAPETDPATDGNGVLVVRATGTVQRGRFGRATRTVEAAVRRLALPLGLVPAALAFPGLEAEVTFNGDAFLIDGRGWRADGLTPDPACPAAFGVSVSATLPPGAPGSHERAVESALSRQQADNVLGRPQDPARPGQGANTIAPAASLDPEAVAAFAAQAKRLATLALESRQPDGLSFQSVRWGTEAEPAIVYVRGEPDPTSRFTALRLSGDSQGWGVLVVEDGDVRISGDFRWRGPIVVTGRWVGLGFLGGGHQEIDGAVVVNETATDPGAVEGVVTGNAVIRYSCEALARALPRRARGWVSAWREARP